LRFVAHDYEVRSSEEVFQGKIIKVHRDQVTMPGGNESTRDVVDHPGAVGVVALDNQGRIMLIKQYRHPVKESLWELPAGLLDVEGEQALDTAKRELGEEAGLSAERWNVLADMLTSPGMTNEAARVYLARDVSDLGEQSGSAEDEEADLELAWVPLDEALISVLSGGIRNAMAVIGILATARARDAEFENLREETAPWPDRFDRVPQLVDRQGASTPEL
jgi:ADP-ribose pyrophosphatase